MASKVAQLLCGVFLCWSFELQAACEKALRVMTFNLRYDQGGVSSYSDVNGWNNPQNPRSQRVKDLIYRWQPDIIGTQEGLQNQIADLSAAWPFYAFWGVGRDDGEALGEYASIFYRKDRLQFQHGGHFWLSHTPDRPGSSFPGSSNNRMVSWVRLHDTFNAKSYFVVNTHWDHVSEESRRLSAALMVQRLKQVMQPGEFLVVLGDLNNHPESAEVLSLKSGLDLHDAYRLFAPDETAYEATYHGFKGQQIGRRIDFILTHPGMILIRANMIHDSYSGRYPSDHFPVQAEICW